MQHPKVKTLDEIAQITAKLKEAGRRVVQCHGVFDLLHPGHIRHFKGAKELGDCLVVSLTPDRFVNKGPGRPVFTEALRMESLSALSFVDYVVLNDRPDAVSAISTIRPDLYVKGAEYRDHDADVTGKIADEMQAVVACGGKIHYTDDIVFSSSSLLNRFFENRGEKVQAMIDQISARYTIQDLQGFVEKLAGLKVLVVGDAIIDHYQYVSHLGQSGKGQHLVAACLEEEKFLGGAFAIADHVAQFAAQVTLLTAVGYDCDEKEFIKSRIGSRIDAHLIPSSKRQTLVKKRYLNRDGPNLNKLFETYNGTYDNIFTVEGTKRAVEIMKKERYDLVIACDFGNGFSNETLVREITQLPTFLAVNTQINSGNRGYNVITQYQRADYISLNEPELRLALHDRRRSVEELVKVLIVRMNAQAVSVTQGVNGVISGLSSGDMVRIPALVTQVIDRVGAGDSFLSLSAMGLAAKVPADVSVLFGSIAAAMNVQTVGNLEPVKKVPFSKFLVRLFK